MKQDYRHLKVVAILLVGLLVGSLMRADSPKLASAASSAAAQTGALGQVSIDGVVTNLALRGYQWQIEQPSLAAAGGGAGKATFRSLEVTTDLNPASVPLFLATAKGSLYTSATITIFAPGTSSPLISYRLSNVLIAGVSDGASAASKPLETVALSYQQIKVTYSASAGPISGEWDLLQNAQLP